MLGGAHLTTIRLIKTTILLSSLEQWKIR